MRTRTLSRRAIFRLLTLAALLSSALFSSFTSQATAQVRIPASAMLDENRLEQVYQQGRTLEEKNRWGEALSHYEKALKEFPNLRDLEHRKSVARAHFELGRRYADTSYTKSLTEMNFRQARDLYAEVLLKIQAHYVHSPDWNGLLHRGLLYFDVALSKPAFQQRHLAQATPQQRTELSRMLHNSLENRMVRTRGQAEELLARAAHEAGRRYGLSPQVVIAEFACAATSALDPYSTFLTADQLDEVFSQIEGNFVGLGIEIKADDHTLLVVNVIRGGPADKAGIRSGDRIVGVSGKSTREVSTDTAADMLKGTEGSFVQVTVQNPEGADRRLRVQRRRVEVPCVEDVKIVDRENGVGYFRLTSFQKTTNRDVDAALWQLHRAGMKSLIVDVRGNPGGLLNASVDVADKFITSGTIVSTRGRSPREDYDYKAHRNGTWSVPLIVLIDGNSASASEIFAGAIRDHRRGTVVGQRSYGKGSVQGIFPLNVKKSGVRLTTAKFYSPSGQPISNRGVQPDVVVHTAAKPVNPVRPQSGNEDAVLKAALQVARQQLSQR